MPTDPADPSDAIPLSGPLPLEWIPTTMRRMLDRAAVRISLAQWQQLPLQARRQLDALSTDPQADPAPFAQALREALADAGAGEPRPL